MKIPLKIKNLARNSLYAIIGAGALAASYWGFSQFSEKKLYETPAKTQIHQTPEKPRLEAIVSENTQNPDLNQTNLPLIYDSEIKAHYMAHKFKIKGLKIGEYSNEPEDRTYLFFDGREHDNKGVAYLSFGTRLIIGTPRSSFSPSVEFLPENPYLDIKDNDFLMIQAIGREENSGHIEVENKNWRKQVPRATAYSTGYIVQNGERAVKYNKDNEKNINPGILRKNPVETTGKKPIPFHIVTCDKIGQRTLEYDLVFDKYGRIKAGTGRELDNYPGSLRYGEYSSIRQDFHDLSMDEQDKIKEKEIQRELKRMQENPSESQETPRLNLNDFSQRDFSNLQGDYRGQGGDGLKPPVMPKYPISKNKFFFNGEEYTRQPNSNKFISPSGKIININ